MPTPGDRPLDDIDQDLRQSASNRESARREIRRLMDVVIAETAHTDRLLAERSRASQHHTARSIEDDLCKLEATP